MAATLVDSALHTGLLGHHEWGLIRESLPSDLVESLNGIDGVHESGTETLVFWRMRRLGIVLSPQIAIPTVGRVDFVAGRRLVIEVDGYTYHSDPERFERDRNRDALLSKLGYRVLRFSYKQVLHRWQEVEDAILAAIARGDDQ